MVAVVIAQHEVDRARQVLLKQAEVLIERPRDADVSRQEHGVGIVPAQLAAEGDDLGVRQELEVYVGGPGESHGTGAAGDVSGSSTAP